MVSPVVPKPHISVEQYDEMLDNQGGRCLICRKKPGRVRLSLDHDHKTGRIRGLLHQRCNRALGPFEYDDQIIENVIDYLLKILLDHRSKRKEVEHG